MAQKCAICNNKVELTFLQKPLGTWMRNDKGKKKLICQNCQKTSTDQELKEKL